MSNRHVGQFLDHYRAVILDIITYDPTLATEMERDMSRIVSSVNTRGISVLLKDLPEVGKLFEAALSTGRLARSDLPFMGHFRNGTPVPRLFKGLWLRCFDASGCRLQSIDPVIPMFMLQLCYMYKKYRIDPPDAALYATTEEFYKDDESLPPPTLDWSGGSRTLRHGGNLRPRLVSTDRTDQLDLFRSDTDSDAKLLDIVQRVADIISSDLGEFLVPDRSRHGVGAVAEGLRGIQKFGLREYPSRLEQTFPSSGFFTRLGNLLEVTPGEQPSILLAVPKTIKGPRLIAKEPTAHMYAQLSIMDWLYSRIPHCIAGRSICFTDQTISGQLALSASATGSHGTIDLKSASDRVSLWLIERMFGANRSLLYAMADCRTQFIDLSMDKKLQKIHRLKKFTTQGSALTFPIQSLVFLMISIGAIIHDSNERVTGSTIRRIANNVRIYGDDIIVPTDRVKAVMIALEKLHLKVNTQKTHYLGKFRESCGVRAYDGVDITPSYIPTHAAGSDSAECISVIQSSNNLAKKWLFNLANRLLSAVPRSILDSIPFSAHPSRPVYVHSFSGVKIPKSVKIRYNRNLQREEALLMSTKSRRKKLNADGSLLLDAFLGTVEGRRVDHIVEDWYPSSRWETRTEMVRVWSTTNFN